MKKHVWLLVILGSLATANAATGAEPGWEGGIIRFGAEREQIRNMHVLDRPYRLFHVYGNTVRRLYYRGQLLPSFEDVSRMLDLSLMLDL
ncbi:MAG: hypothetical protein ACQESR_10795 [Planctomycetota bacterium]